MNSRKKQSEVKSKGERESEVTHLYLTLATPWTVAYQASSSMGFSRQEYWSGVPLPSLRVSVLLFHKEGMVFPLKVRIQERERRHL